jgi:FkbM family methyltransferase
MTSLVETLPLRARFARWFGHTIRVPKARRLPWFFYPPSSPRARVRMNARLRNGQTFAVDTRSYLEWVLWVYGEYEPDTQAIIRRYLRPGDVAIDVGANIGIHTLPMAEAVGPQGVVLAVEPLPSVRERLERNLALNRATNVRVIAQAASDREGTAQLYPPRADAANWGQASLARMSHLDPTAPIDVPLVTLDALVRAQGLDRVRLIKVDVEGHDREVMAGAIALIDRYHPVLIFEFSPEHTSEIGNDWEDTVRLLVRQRSYRLSEMWRGALNPLGQRPPRRQCMVLGLPPGLD